MIPRLVWALSLTVSPATVDVVVPAGSSGHVSISVGNSGGAPIYLATHLFDWWHEDDDYVFPPPGSTRHSAVLWSSVLPREMVLEAGTTNQLTLVVAPPETASGGYFAVLFIDGSMGPAPGDESGTGVAVAGRIGVLVAVRIDGTGHESMEIAAVDVVAPTATTPLAIGARVKNTGDVHFRPESRALILDSQGQARAQLAGLGSIVLPGQEAVIESSWGGELAAGAHTALVTVVFGAGQAATVESSFAVEEP